MSEPVNTLRTALAYAERGIKVLPLAAWDAPDLDEKQRGKVPTIDKGLKVATDDAAQIETWWSSRPGANVGIATGSVSGFWVLDVDGEEGAATLARLEAEHGPLPETPEQSTARGRHICFAWNPERPVRNSSGRTGGTFDERGKLTKSSGLDVRGDGGYIVAAPSKHAAGHVYRWHDERRMSKMAFAQAPEWLLALAEKKPEAPRSAPPANSSPHPQAPPAKPGAKLISPWAEKILREECEKIATAVDGTVNETLNRCSFNVGTIVGSGELSETIARAALIEAGMVVCKPPWTILNVSQHVERALADGIQHPREKPELAPRPPRMQPAPRREARTTTQEQQDQAPSPANLIDIRDPNRGYTPDTAWERGLIRDEDGKPVNRITNAILFLIHHRDMLGVLAFDLFASKVTLQRRPPWEAADGTEWEPRALSDNDVTWATSWLEYKGFTMKPAAIHGACLAAAQRNSFNPAVDWLCEQKWDSEERLSTWLAYYMGATSKDPRKQEYINSVGRKWLIGAVARIMRPGCKMDTMLILEGSQGIGKSKAAAILGTFGKHRFFTDEVGDIGSKDAAMQLQGVSIVELAELDKFGKADVNTLKAWLTRTVDRYRPPYGRAVVEAPRQSVLIGTMNPGGHGYLDDATGGRRFWPVTVKACAADDLAKVQPQLWAEALQAFRDGESWWLDDDELIESAKEEQASRYAEDPWAGPIDNYIATLTAVTTATIAGTSCLGIELDRQNQSSERRIAKHLKARGWLRVRRWDGTERKNKWIFVRPSDVDDGEE